MLVKIYEGLYLRKELVDVVEVYEDTNTVVVVAEAVRYTLVISEDIPGFVTELIGRINSCV